MFAPEGVNFSTALKQMWCNAFPETYTAVQVLYKSCLAAVEPGSTATATQPMMLQQQELLEDCIDSQRANSLPSALFLPYFYLHVWDLISHNIDMHYTAFKWNYDQVSSWHGHLLPTYDSFAGTELWRLVASTFWPLRLVTLIIAWQRSTLLQISNGMRLYVSYDGLNLSGSMPPAAVDAHMPRHVMCKQQVTDKYIFEILTLTCLFTVNFHETLMTKDHFPSLYILCTSTHHIFAIQFGKHVSFVTFCTGQIAKQQLHICVNGTWKTTKLSPRATTRHRSTVNKLITSDSTTVTCRHTA